MKIGNLNFAGKNKGRMKKRILPLTVILLTLCAATQAITAQVAPQVESFASSTDSETVVKSAPLYGKTINVIGDSYVKNHKRPFTEAWHYLVAEKYHMTYRNYGRNGRCLVFNREAEKWGKPLLDFYKEMNDTADYVLVIGGHNDADYIARGKGTL